MTGLSIHEMTIRALQRAHPSLRRRGFADSMRDLARTKGAEWDEWGKDDPELFWADFPTLRRPQFIPDLYEIDHEAREVTLYEVEDTSDIDEVKLTKLLRLLQELDADCAYSLRVIVMDRYGDQQRELPLFAMWCEWLAHDVEAVAP